MAALDPSPHPPPAGGGGEVNSPALLKSARDFEALTIGQLLAPMFATVDTAHGPFGGGQAEEAWRPMLADAIAKQIAAHGSLGFAGPVYDALLRAQEQQPGAGP